MKGPGCLCLTRGLTGSMDYGNGNYEVRPSSYSVAPGGLLRETTSLVGTSKEVAVASYNVHDLSPDVADDDQRSVLAAQITPLARSHCERNTMRVDVDQYTVAELCLVQTIQLRQGLLRAVRTERANDSVYLNDCLIFLNDNRAVVSEGHASCKQHCCNKNL